MTINIKCQNAALALGIPNLGSQSIAVQVDLLEYQNRSFQQLVEEGIPAQKAAKVNALNTDGF